MSENKGELIYREVLDADLRKRYCKSCARLENCNLIACEVGFALDEIEEAPAVDAVEVVRCGYCKNKGLCCLHNGRYVGQFDDDDFCSYGERKNGEDNA